MVLRSTYGSVPSRPCVAENMGFVAEMQAWPGQGGAIPAGHAGRRRLAGSETTGICCAQQALRRCRSWGHGRVGFAMGRAMRARPGSSVIEASQAVEKKKKKKKNKKKKKKKKKKEKKKKKKNNQPRSHICVLAYPFRSHKSRRTSVPSAAITAVYSLLLLRWKRLPRGIAVAVLARGSRAAVLQRRSDAVSHHGAPLFVAGFLSAPRAMNSATVPLSSPPPTDVAGPAGRAVYSRLRRRGSHGVPIHAGPAA